MSEHPGFARTCTCVQHCGCFGAGDCGALVGIHAMEKLVGVHAITLGGGCGCEKLSLRDGLSAKIIESR
jgi:hypothetical protein